MKKFTIVWGVALSLALLISCKKSNEGSDRQEQRTLFSKYVAIGNSLSAGYANHGLYRAGQLVAYPNLMAQQMQKLGAGDFRTPLFSEDKANGSGYMVLDGLTDGIPRFKQIDTELAFRSFDLPLLEKYTDSIENLGVPGMRMDMAFAPGLGTAEGNMYFERLLSSDNAMTTYFDYSVSQNHSFFSFSLGNNDVLGYAANGAVTTGPTTVLTSLETFQSGLTKYIGALTANGQKGVIATIPEVTSTPYFSTVTKELLLGQINQASEGGFQELYIATKDGVRSAGSDDLFVLEMATNGLFGVDGYGLFPDHPIADQYVLDRQEVLEVQERTIAFNRLIRDLARDKDLALADVHQFLNEVKGGITVEGVTVNADYITGKAFSLDGIHLTPIANALMANLFLQAINNQYQSEIPLLSVKAYLSE